MKWVLIISAGPREADPETRSVDREFLEPQQGQAGAGGAGGRGGCGPATVTSDREL